MPVLPIPMIIALALLGLLSQRLLTRKTQPALLALIAICATQSAIIALVQYYGLTMIRPAQPLLATTIAPIAWLAFTQAAGGPTKPRLAWLHGLGLAIAAICLVINPALLDVVIPVSFFGYGLAMLLSLSRGEDGLPNSPLEGGNMPLMAWRIVAVSLIASAACDVFIAYNLAMGAKSTILWVPSLVSSLSLLSLGALSLSHAIESRRDHPNDEAPISSEDAERDLSIIEKLDNYIATHKPYLDPDLTLSRLSRKVLIPAKQLSTAINRVKGENVSRYINQQRIDEAARRMQAGQTVTAAMLDSGFNTKSNFNREFLRIKKMPPREWQTSLLNNRNGNTISVIQDITEKRKL